MGSLDVITGILVKLLGLDPLNVPSPIAVLGFSITVILAAFWACMVWFTLKLIGSMLTDAVEVASSKRRIVIARGLTRHDYEQIRKGIRAWNLLVVRYGTESYLSGQAAEADRQIGRPRYSTLRMKLSHTGNGEVTLSWSLPLHRRLGTQFRCYIALRDKGADMLAGMLKHYDEIEVLDPEVEDPTRIYFLLKRFPIVTTPEGIRQNVAYPE